MGFVSRSQVLMQMRSTSNYPPTPSLTHAPLLWYVTPVSKPVLAQERGGGLSAQRGSIKTEGRMEDANAMQVFFSQYTYELKK